MSRLEAAAEYLHTPKDAWIAAAPTKVLFTYAEAPIPACKAGRNMRAANFNVRQGKGGHHA